MAIINDPYHESSDADLCKEIEALRHKLEQNKKDYEIVCEVLVQRDEEIRSLKSRLKSVGEVADHAEGLLAKRNTALNKAASRADWAEAEIIRLKAKLYDYMVSEEDKP